MGPQLQTFELKVEGERVYDAEADYGHPPTWEWKVGIDTLRTSDDGSFLFRQLGSGKYLVHAMDPADPNCRITVDAVAGGRPLEIVMDPEVLDGRTIEGTVVDAFSGCRQRSSRCTWHVKRRAPTSSWTWA